MDKVGLNFETESHEKQEKGTFKFELGNTDLDIEIIKKEGHPNEPVITSLILDNRKGKKMSLLGLLPAGWEVVLYGMPSLSAKIVSAKTRLVERQILLQQNYARERYEDVTEGETPEEIKIKKADPFFGSLFSQRDFLKGKNKVQIFERVPVFEDNPGALIVLLHEIGHVLHPNNDSLPEDWRARIGYLWSRPNREGADKVPEERDAWSFAIRILRKLRDDSFDFGDVFNRQNISEYVDYPLRTYGDPKKQKNKNENS